MDDNNSLIDVVKDHPITTISVIVIYVIHLTNKSESSSWVFDSMDYW